MPCAVGNCNALFFRLQIRLIFQPLNKCFEKISDSMMKLSIAVLIVALICGKANAGNAISAAEAEATLTKWSKTLPAHRKAALETLARTPSGLNSIFDAVAKGVMAPVEIPPEVRAKLVKSDGKKANQLLSPASSPDRGEFVKTYQAALQRKGSVDAGARVFGACRSCHAFGGRGPAIGPDLAKLPDRSAEYLVKAILDPNDHIAPEFVYYLVDLKDFRSLGGIVIAETEDTITLAAPGGGTAEVVKLDQIDEMHASKLSLMPEGMENLVRTSAFPDLIAFLQQPVGGK